MKELVIYDDTGRKSEVITDIIGEKGFSEVVVKKRKLEDYYKDNINKIYDNVLWKKIGSIFEYSELIKELEKNYDDGDIRIIHCFSNYLITDIAKVELCFKKLKYIDYTYKVVDGKRVVAVMFKSLQEYLGFCKKIVEGEKAWDLAKKIEFLMEVEGMVDIGVVSNFIQCITGNFDSRYFNSLQGDEYTIVKKSSNKNKIKAEYNFYHLLPDDMKYWFVMPFNYVEEEDYASYTMERLHMTDLAIKWVHGSMDENEFEDLLDKYFYFFSCRHSKKCTKEEYRKIADELYVEKVINRIECLKKIPEYIKIEKLLSISEETDIDFLLEKYFALKEKIEVKNSYPLKFVIGHGDPCFANSMYNKSTKTLKFIDPKGAIKENDLWTNEYYDIAKLSHSICGRYDFFNNALFDIRIDEKFRYKLDIPFDNSKYIEIFKRKIEENGYDYLTVRIYEASLFLSMLPLHIDNPHKVFGFILNVKKILEEIEEDV